MFVPSSFNTYSIVPAQKTVEDGLVLIELGAGHKDGNRFEYAAAMFVTDEAIAASQKQKEFTSGELDQVESCRSMRKELDPQVYFFCVNDEIVGYGIVIDKFKNVGILIQYDLRKTGLASFFAEIFVNMFPQYIGKSYWGGLLDCANNRQKEKEAVAWSTYSCVDTYSAVAA